MVVGVGAEEKMVMAVAFIAKIINLLTIALVLLNIMLNIIDHRNMTPCSIIVDDANTKKLEGTDNISGSRENDVNLLCFKEPIINERSHILHLYVRNVRAYTGAPSRILVE